MASPSSWVDPCSLQGSLESPVVISNGKTSPKKSDLTSHSKPQVDLVVNNNEEEIVQQRRRSHARLQRNKELAAKLLQRHVQVWLLKRQETMRVQEVQRLRGELRKAAVCVIEESFARYVKRRAIHSYLHELGNFETRLDELLQRCLICKQQMEVVQRFSTLRRHQKQQEDARKCKVVHDWLRLCLQSRRKKKEQTAARANEKLLGWVQRWMLQKRCDARAAARDREQQLEAYRLSSVQKIAAAYQAYKLCKKAKKTIQYRKHSLTKLYSAIHTVVLRAALSRWGSRIHELMTAHEAASTLQRVYRRHQARVRYARVVASCLELQRMLRGHQARVYCTKLKRCKLQDFMINQRHAAATVIQRYARGLLTRLWFCGVLIKLRERFRCANCGALESGGRYCKYCGRHRPSFGPMSNELMFHEKWQLRRSPKVSQDELASLFVNDPSDVFVPTVPSSKKPTHLRYRSTSLRILASSNVKPLTSLPAVLSPRHRRLVPRNSDPLALHHSPIRRNSVASISEQTALRAMAIADLQAKFTTSAQVNVLDMHFCRLQKAQTAINR